MLIRLTKYFITLLLFCFFSPSNAQHIRGAINVGVNATQVDGDEVYGYHKFGWNIGPSAIIPFGKFSVTLENIFNQKGSYQKSAYKDSQKGQYELNLNYLEIPLLLNYTDKKVLTFGTGVSWGKLVSVKEWEDGSPVETTTLHSGIYDRNDWNILADVRFSIIKNLQFNFRYAYSMKRIRTRTFLNGVTRHQFNNVLTFRLIWMFYDKK